MTAWKAIKEGLGTARRSRMEVWILLGANLALAAAAAYPIFRAMQNFIGSSRESHMLLTGFSPDFVTDFYFNLKGSESRQALWILYVGLLAIPVNSILAGGVVARFRVTDFPFSLGEFLNSTRHYAWRLIRLMILGLIIYWAVFRLLNQGLADWLGKWTRDWLDDRPVFWLSLGRKLLLIFVLGFFNMVVDFARVKLVTEEGTSAIQALLSSLGFAIARFRSAAAVYLFPTICGVALLGIYWLAVPWERIHDVYTIALLFLGQQIVMFGRYWFRVSAWAGEWALLRKSRPELVEVTQVASTAA